MAEKPESEVKEETAEEEQKPEEPKETPKEEQKPRERPQERTKEDNVVFVGKKPAMSYVVAAMTQFSSGQPEVYIKARGRSISRAVDVAEVIRNKFVQDIKREVEIGTEEVQDSEKGTMRVSTINITLRK